MKKYVLVTLTKKSEKIIDLCKILLKFGFEIIATEGTANYLKSFNIPVTNIRDIIKISETFKNKIKTLNETIYKMILADRNNKDEINEIKDIGTIDIIIINLYNYNFENIYEFKQSIDIGGRSLIKAAIKNSNFVTILIHEEDYDRVIEELNTKGYISNELKNLLSLKAWEYLIEYEIKGFSYYYEKIKNEQVMAILLKNGIKLKYGENPHQKAYLFQNITDPSISFKKIWGEELTYNNCLDIDRTIRLLGEFKEITCTIIKHANPCCVSCDPDPKNAFIKAYNSDPISAFGGILGINSIINSELAEIISNYHFDIIIAKEYDEKALSILKKRKRLKIIECKNLGEKISQAFEIRSIINGILLQERDLSEIKIENLKFVSKRKPTNEEVEDLIFSWKVAKHVSSNAIVIAKNKTVLGIGCGQTSRIDATKLAISKAYNKYDKAVLASDGFIPFRDNIDVAGRNNITAIIEPGGSIRDKEIIEAANEYDIALVFTGIRIFKH